MPTPAELEAVARGAPPPPLDAGDRERIAAGRMNGRWVWPNTSRGAVTPSSSSASSSAGSGRKLRTSDWGEPWQNIVSPSV